MKLEEYFQKIMNLVDSLNASGRKISHEDHIMHISARLGPEYDSTVSVITDKDEYPSLQRVYSQLLAQENRIERHSSVNPDGLLPSVNLTTQKQSKQTPNPFSATNSDNMNQQNKRLEQQWKTAMSSLWKIWTYSLEMLLPS